MSLDADAPRRTRRILPTPQYCNILSFMTNENLRKLYVLNSEY